jgi:hypothetical protein
MEGEVMEQLKKLHEARQRLLAAKDAQAALLEKLYNTDSWVKAEGEKQKATDDIETLEGELKAHFLAEFKKTLNKAPYQGIQVKEFPVTECTYDPKRAHTWCLSNFTPALKLDTKAFEKAAADGTVPDDIATVTVTKEPRVQIAADLSKFLSTKENE